MLVKYLFTTFLIFCFSMAVGQGLISPSDYLGYELGEKFTPSHKVEGYIRQVAAASPGRIRIIEYGKSYEGRALYAAVIANETNMARLEEIRKNNLRMTGLLSDKKPDGNSPVIVWLSYNVHGNEASSSEVAMKVVYDLVKDSNAGITQWLQSAVIIVDPCLNPDGRDRYVNWYNQVAGIYPNANIEAREHHEPWPGGRSNHYNFDLNRDWVWQSQVETQQRVALYNEWMPAIHVDFHEQYPGNPYYFAPAAEPLHEAITSFQRNFQTEIGMNHAKYFDAKGWLYFTKEYFDLFYPAYGDTYPIFNGAIGMTYEQAGHSLAGLAYALEGPDTLKLKDRIDHHYTTSMSTIEISAANAAKVNSEFKKYFDESNATGSGNYKSYVIKNSDAGKTKALLQLFDRNKIMYQFAGKAVNVKGYNYHSGKDGNYTTAANDIIVPGVQPKATLVRVLFEPQSKLVDSATYDITAWSLPYVYGLEAYAVKERIAGSSLPSSDRVFKADHSVYGYLVSYSSLEDGKLLAALLNNGIRTRFAEKDFSYNKQFFKKGTLVILHKGNESVWNLFEKIINHHKSTITPVSSGFMESGFDFGSDKLHLVKKPSVALITGKGVYATAAGEIWHLFDQQLNYPVTLINLDDLPGLALKNYDVIIMPDGNYKFLGEKEGSADLKNWVRQGGKLIALENAVAQMAAGDWGIKLKKEEEQKDDDKKVTYDDIKKYGNRERDWLVNNIPGAIFRIELDNTHPLAFGYPDYYYTMKLDDKMYSFLKDAWNVGVFKKNNQVAGFVGSRIRNRIEDGTSIAVQQMGKGSVIYFADNPLFRSFWENGKLLFTNAVFLVGQ